MANKSDSQRGNIAIGITLLGLVFNGGVNYQRINTNEDNIEVNKEDIKDNKVMREDIKEILMKVSSHRGP